MENVQINKNKYGYSAQVNGVDVCAGEYEIWIGADGVAISVPIDDVHAVMDAMRNANRYAERA